MHFATAHTAAEVPSIRGQADAVFQRFPQDPSQILALLQSYKAQPEKHAN
jgi:hypothetical protein